MRSPPAGRLPWRDSAPARSARERPTVCCFPFHLRLGHPSIDWFPACQVDWSIRENVIHEQSNATCVWQPVAGMLWTDRTAPRAFRHEIGRASCRERVRDTGSAGTWRENKEEKDEKA